MYAQPVPASVHASTGCTTKNWVIGTAEVVLTAASPAPDGTQATADARKDRTYGLDATWNVSLIASLLDVRKNCLIFDGSSVNWFALGVAADISTPFASELAEQNVAKIA